MSATFAAPAWCAAAGLHTVGAPITSKAGSQPIVRLRTGAPMYDGNGNNCDFDAEYDWTGPANRVNTTSLRFSCCPVVSAYPDGVFHSCNFAGGLSWFRGSNGWAWGATNSLEMYFR